MDKNSKSCMHYHVFINAFIPQWKNQNCQAFKKKIKIHAFIYAFKTKANHKFPCIQNKNKL